MYIYIVYLYILQLFCMKYHNISQGWHMHKKSKGPSAANVHHWRTIPVLQPRSLSIFPVPEFIGVRQGWEETPLFIFTVSVGFPTVLFSFLLMFPVPQHLGVLLHRITIAPHQCHKPRDGGQLGRHDISHGENDFGSQLNRTFGQSRAGTVAPLELVEQYKYCGIVYIYIYWPWTNIILWFGVIRACLGWS